MIVQSGGQLHAMAPAPPVTTFTPAYSEPQLRGYRRTDYQNEWYARIYASQPNIRIPIDFLAGNVAQLGIHVFRRISDNDRVRLSDHELTQWLAKPNPSTTQFRLIEALLSDLGVYKNAFWLKVRYQDPTTYARAIGLVRLPPERMHVEGGLLPSAFCYLGIDGQRMEFAPSEIVAFGGYNPLDPLTGLSHMMTLDRVIREDAAASSHREYYWRNASRHEGVIERPKDAPKWTDPQKKSFREQWQARFAGAPNAGLVAVLEDGMSFKPVAFSPKDSEFTLGGKLRREITAAEFNVPQPSIGILDHATFSNIKEQHKQLYQDSLGPTIEMVTQEIERQLLIECTDQTNVYIEFNIAAKLAGSFEDQANAIRVLVGRPIMTPNEGRSRLNLPAIKDDPTANQLAPQQGGPSDATAPPPPLLDDDASDGDEGVDDDPALDVADPTDDGAALVQFALETTRARQVQRLAKIAPADRSTAFRAELDRWNRELAADLAPIVGAERAQQLAERTNAALFLELDARQEAAA